MENLSRVRKNAELRQEVENSRESEVTSTVLSSYADRLNRINPELSTIETSPKLPDYNALHSKGETDRTLEPTIVMEDPNFHHDLLNEFIDEVKSYNIKKGYSTSEDTDLNIINKVNQPVLSVENDSSKSDDKMTQEIRRVIESDFDVEEVEFNDDFNRSNNGNMFEETAKIKLKLDSVDKELLEMSQSVNSSSRTLNFIVFILVIVLMVMLGLAFYWIFSTQGF
ncbi:MAG: hypothetical protein HGB31_00345 [Erysipelotrichaceae bacterium]|nr:hypothetical protein [Erysipelotrichaceae bacterium]